MAEITEVKQLKKRTDAHKDGTWKKQWTQEFEQVRKRYNRYFKKNNVTIILVQNERKEEEYE